MLPNVTRDQIEAALARFDAEHRDSPEFAGWEVKESQRFGLRYAGRLYPPKKVVSLATGAPVSGFSSGRETNAYLAARGFDVEYINLPSENEVRIALQELLLERGPEGVQPAEAYRLLAESLQLPPHLLEKRLGEGEGESHWENRVRFARRKLVTEGRLDGSERGVWRLAKRPKRCVWVEKTLVAGRPDRELGDHALGKALWSPRRTRDDNDGYSAVRDVQPGDLVIHLADNRRFAGVSIAAGTARTDFVGLPGTDWANLPAYRVPLRDYTPCPVEFTRDKLLEVPGYETELRRIRSAHKHLFYDKDLNLNQGHYLTEAVPALALLLNEAFADLAGTPLPHFDDDLLEELGLDAVAAPDADGEVVVPAASGEQAQALDAARSIVNGLDPGRGAWLFAPGEGARFWAEMRQEGLMAIGWRELGDLGQYTSKEEMAARLQELRGREGYPRHDAQACWDFARTVRPGDLVIVKRGQRALLGYGVVTGGYRHEPGRADYRHVRGVEWRLVGEWPSPDLLVTKTLTAKTRSQAERLLAFMTGEGADPSSRSEALLVAVRAPKQPPYSLEDLCEDLGIERERAELWLARLRRKRQVILQGPPGTGKTFVAERLARHLVSETAGRRAIVQFHPSYSYEDFVTGLRPDAQGGALSFRRVPGRFVEFCREAREAGPEVPHVLVIDEINRANLPKVFGELMYLLEYRDHQLHLAGEERPFAVPPNVLLIGTMNTADRSVALVDHALRRRFSFIRLQPDYDLLTRHLEGHGLPAASLVAILKRVNAEIGDENYHIGVSFFMQDGAGLRSTLGEIWQGEIEPYLEELFYGREERLGGLRWARLASGPLSDWASPA